VTILAFAVPLLLAGGGAQAPAGDPSAPLPASGPTAAPSASGPALPSEAKAPTARARYDHVQWREYQGTRLEDTVDRWWNGVDGRSLHRSATGAVTRDVILRVASTASSAVTASSTSALSDGSATAPATSNTESAGTGNVSAAGTLAPTSGTVLMADNIPGVLPSTAAGLAQYMVDNHFPLAQGVESIPLERYLDARQMAALASLARSGASGTESVTLPTGQPAQVLSFAHSSSNGVDDDTRLILDPSGTRILGTTGGTGAHTWWRLVTVSELTATTH
jgi:hypothetical protein